MKYVLALILIIHFDLASAQTDKVFQLDSIEITAEARRTDNLGAVDLVLAPEKIAIGQATQLTELLSNLGNIYIKNYGPGSIASSSFRGANASQTLVLWNGIPVMNPMIAQADFSLMNLQGIDQLSIQRGASSSNWGSGAIAGVIRLDNSANIKDTSTFQSSTEIGIASFNTKEIFQDLRFTMNKWQFHSNYSYESSDNDFSFTSNNTRRRQENAEYSFHNIKQNIYHFLNPSTTISLHYWATIADRNVPPRLSQNSSTASQEEQSHRFLVQLRSVNKRTVLKAKLAYFDEYLDFRDPSQSVDSQSDFDSYLAELSIEGSLNNRHSWLMGINSSLFRANAFSNYADFANEFRSSFFANMIFDLGKLKSKLGLRHEFSTATASIPAMDIALEYPLGKNILLRSKLSKNYRLPGLNDKYWIPGGNPDLKAESGWSYELGITKSFKTEDQEHSFSLGAYERRINNWILWVPMENTPFWSAANVQKVRSRGLEFQYKARLSLNDWHLSYFISIDANKSQNLLALSIPRIEEGEQIWYSPELKSGSGIELGYRGFSLNYQHNYTSSSRGFNEIVPSFNLGNLIINKSISFRSTEAILFFSIRNLWDSDYQVVEQRAMPGRSYKTGIRVQIK